VIGDTVNTASRLESLTKDKGVDVIASEETVRRATAGPIPAALGPRPALEPIGEVMVRGRKEPLKVHTFAAAVAAVAPARTGP
jgi:class 3 adenylate cyclase